MVAITQHHPFGPVHIGFAPEWVFGELIPIPPIILKAVRLEIRFVDYIQAILIAKIEPVGIVRVMRRSHGIDIVPLHHFHIAKHMGTGCDMAEVRMRVVAVNALQGNRLSIDQHSPVLNGDLPESYCEPLHREHTPSGIGECQQQRV